MKDMLAGLRFGSGWCGAMLCAASLTLAMLGTASASPIYLEAGGVVVGEGEIFSRRTADLDGTTWKVVPTEVSNPADNAQPISGARGGEYVQILPDDDTAGGGPLAPASIEYDMQIGTAGTYQLYVRWDGNGLNSITSDSLFADIVQLKDGTTPAFGTGTNLLADWYELFQGIDADFSTSPWDGLGGREENLPVPSDFSMTWVIATPGLYTLRFSQREDGAAVDAWAFQLNSLAPPSGNGPAISAIVPEPGTGLLAMAGILGLGLSRKAPSPDPA